MVWWWPHGAVTAASGFKSQHHRAVFKKRFIMGLVVGRLKELVHHWVQRRFKNTHFFSFSFFFLILCLLSLALFFSFFPLKFIVVLAL